MITTAVILAAGQGTRMKSKLPKVLHPVGGKPMVQWVIDQLGTAGISEKIAVLGHGSEQVAAALDGQCQFVKQQQQLGTGHAVMQAAEALPADGQLVLVICGDTPLLTANSLEQLIKQHQDQGNAVTLMTAKTQDPFGYGRIIRQAEGITAIVEQKDASVEQQNIQEINTGTYCFDQRFLLESLPQLTTNNAQQEYYLTDLISIAVAKGLMVNGYLLDDFSESLGINNRVQLAQAEKILRERKARELMLEGVTLLDPEHTYIEASVLVGPDTVIFPGVILQGNTIIGTNNLIGTGTRIKDSTIGDENEIQNTVITESIVGNRCKVGPYAYLRPGAVLADQVKIGDFVEVKKSQIGEGSKIPHLSYIGDSTVGRGVNIGCGTITCNYDGVHKHQTNIEDHAFIGSNTNLVAPVTIEQGSFIGAGSTITKNVPSYSLALTRAELQIRENWVKKKQEGKSQKEPS